MPTEILVPLDYTEESRKALEFASALAVQLGLGLTLLHFWQCPPVARHAKAAHPESGAPTPIADLLVAGAKAELSGFVSQVSIPAEVRVKSELREGNPTEEIITLSQSGAYSWIVMGTRGHTGLSHLMHGSTAEGVVRLSPIPVITVPLAKAQA
ncbi:MAG: universal stress protein [Polyangiaceae bacterium]|nr:universal stress protein [Polyangiaceae bacterium]